MYKSKYIFKRFVLLNRWKQPHYMKNSNWCLFGFTYWWSGPDSFRRAFHLFGLDFCFWYNVKHVRLK